MHVCVCVCVYMCVGVCSRALLSNALAGSAHLAVQFHHLQHGFLSAAAQMVKHTVVLLWQSVQHAEHITTATGPQLLLYELQFGLAAMAPPTVLLLGNPWRVFRT